MHVRWISYIHFHIHLVSNGAVDSSCMHSECIYISQTHKIRIYISVDFHIMLCPFFNSCVRAPSPYLSVFTSIRLYYRARPHP